jgi:predicted nucleotidyltransferase
VGQLSGRRADTQRRLEDLRSRLANASTLAAGEACVYGTGSFGRGEASSHSDLDLFIVGKAGERGRSLLSRLDEICIKADLIEITREAGIPEFSGDGQYLTHYSVNEFTKSLGTPEDDSKNTFTARLLLLLESCPIVGPEVYQDVTGEVIAAYWRDFEDHKADFVPAFLANDILRLWRTFCVNYEARTSREPADAKAKGKLKNYKLKHSRLLTCYSGLIYLLAIFSRNQTVTPLDAIDMIRLTPTQRLEWLLEQEEFREAHHSTQSSLSKYEAFLDVTNATEEALLEQFKDRKKSREYMEDAQAFGDSVYDVITKIGPPNRLRRLLLV